MSPCSTFTFVSIDATSFALRVCFFLVCNLQQLHRFFWSHFTPTLFLFSLLLAKPNLNNLHLLLQLNLCFMRPSLRLPAFQLRNLKCRMLRRNSSTELVSLFCWEKRSALSETSGACLQVENSTNQVLTYSQHAIQPPRIHWSMRKSTKKECFASRMWTVSSVSTWGQFCCLHPRLIYSMASASERHNSMHRQ
jgi:hypothetical protein